MNEGRKLSFKYSISDFLVGKVNVSSPYQNYNARGNPTSFGVDMDFPEIQLSKTLKSSDFYLLRGKIEATMSGWEIKYQRYLDIRHKECRADSVDEMNREAKEYIAILNGILSHTLDVNDAVDWDSIKRKDSYRKNLPEQPTLEKVKSEYGFFSRLFRGGAIGDDFEQRLGQWRKVVGIFESKKNVFEEEKKRNNDALDDIKARYSGADPKAVEEYCDLVLNSSEYPDYFPKNWRLEYREGSRMVVLDYDLPSPSQLPTVESYKYVKARDEITKKHMAESDRKKLYNSVIYQICIRTIHELFEADVVNAIDAVAFNGLVTSINHATGINETKVIVSLSAEKSKFLDFDLSKVDPKATFKHLKGVAATTLADLTPIPPIIKIDKTDKRFIDGKAVAYQLYESLNIAAMNWGDFEHLVRELFEKEFISSGGEVKVTQASSDGGVDAVAFDPDPIRGGKIIIQAKRYTNIVGVSAVRDLYGTVMNEGATKGILVTTSDYGKDSYEFAKDKPITLLNGSNLLSLLEKHGHKARIDVREAKKILNG